MTIANTTPSAPLVEGVAATWADADSAQNVLTGVWADLVGQSRAVAVLRRAVAEAPARGDGANAGTNGVPAEMGRTPTEVRGVPAEVSGTPTGAKSMPAGVGRTPTGVDGAPAEIGEIPTGVDGAPTEMGRIPVEPNGTRTGVNAAPSGAGKASPGVAPSQPPTQRSHAMTHAWLITGPPGSGRSTTAKAFAAALQCPQGGCGVCQECRTALAGSHPDVTLVRTEKLSIGVDQIRELVRRSAMTPTSRKWQVLVIEDADRITHYGANALLNSIE
ncbi:MAG: hypothetical protein LBH11_03240, partial [Propionibacteriaceae bacterium]|nr:hypothetical protein [Propionibacteriaceae bacterium]